MLTKRQEDILKIIVETYVRSADAVSSNNICELLDVSSATVRNEMSLLEKQGYIEKAHFASGRTPTEEGYKYYVTYLISESRDDDAFKIRTLFQNSGIVLKDAVLESVKLISELTNYSVVMLGNHSKSECLKEVRIVEVDKHSVVSIIVTNTGKVFNQIVKVDEELDFKELEKTVSTINELLVDTPLSEVNNKLEDEIKPVIHKFIQQHNALCEAFLESIRNISKKKDVLVEGRENLLFQPDFDDIDVIRKLIREFNDETLLELLNYSDEINFKIGHDNEISDDLSVITTTYSAGNDETNIAVIGPKRMDYNKVVNLLTEIKENLERLNKERNND